MAKGARSSNLKANKSRLKKRVFGPVEDARTARLSEALLELAKEPKASAKPVTAEDTQMETQQESKETENDNDATAMEVDDSTTEKNPSSRKAEKKRKEIKAARIEKKRRSKPRNEMVFKKKVSGRRK